MYKIIPLTKEYVKKFNLSGIDMSLGFAKYTIGVPRWKFSNQDDIISGERVNYLFDHHVEYGVITRRLILWMLKVEVKSVVKSDYKFA